MIFEIAVYLVPWLILTAFVLMFVTEWLKRFHKVGKSEHGIVLVVMGYYVWITWLIGGYFG